MKVLVSNTTRASGIAIATSLGKQGYEVIGIDARALIFNSRSRYIKRQYIVPGFKKESQLDQVFDILKKEKPDLALFDNPSLDIMPYFSRESRYIREFKLVQETLNVLKLYIVPEKSFTASVGVRLCSAIAGHIPQTNVNYELCENIKRENSGKLRAFSSLLLNGDKYGRS